MSLRSFIEDLLNARPHAERALDRIPPTALAGRASHSIPPHPCECAPLPYRDELVQAAVRAAKYRGHVRAAELLGIALAPFLSELVADRRMFGRFETCAIVPIPLSQQRYRERGYNQVERIATALLVELADPTLGWCDTLERVRETPSQTAQSSRHERFLNMTGVFQVRHDLVRDRDVILLDDVVTTGATLSAAQTALYHAGAREVLCVAVAH